MANNYFSYRQLYKLFGCKKELNDTKRVFNSLLTAVAYAPENSKWIPTLMPCSDGLEYQSNPFGCYCPDWEKIRKSLPQYLGKESSHEEMMRIDAALLVLKQEIAKLKRIPWYLLKQRFQAYALVEKLGRPLVKLEVVFQFLEYRAEQAGINQSELHENFMHYANPANLMLL